MAAGKDVRAGGAFWELFAKDNLTGVLDRIKRKALTFQAFMSKVGNASLAAGAGLAAPLVALFKGATDRAADVAKLSAQFGVPIELMSKMRYAAEEAGVSIDEVMADTEGRFAKLIASAPSIDPAQAQQALETQRAFGEATDALQQAMLPLLDTVTPLVKTVAEFVKENASAIRILVPVAAGLLAFGVAAKLAAVAAFGVAVAIKGIGVAVGFLLSPIGLVAAGLAALGYLFVTQTEVGERFSGWIKGGLLDALGSLKVAWQGIGDAMAKGDLALAGQIALKGLEVVWRSFVVTLTDVWNGFKGIFVDGWHAMVLGARLVLNDLTSWVTKAFTYIGAGIVNTFSRITVAVLSTAISAAKAIDSLDPTDSLQGAIAWAEAARAAAEGTRIDAGGAAAEVDRGRDAERDRLLAADAKAKAERDAARAGGAATARAEEEQAKKELADLVAKAAEKSGPAAKPDAPDLSKRFQMADAVKGTFSGAALGLQFGVSDKAQQQTELLKQINDGKGGLADEIGKAVADKMSIK